VYAVAPWAADLGMLWSGELVDIQWQEVCTSPGGWMMYLPLSKTDMQAWVHG
jgi:hypothetical protein